MRFYIDVNTDRDLPFYSAIPGGQLSAIEWCRDKCGSGSHKFAGVQNGNECWCGSSFGKHGLTELSECSYNCNINNPDSFEKCGAPNRLNVYTRVASVMLGLFFWIPFEI